MQATLSATVSAITSGFFSSFYWNYLLKPFIQYLLSPAVIAVILLKFLDLGGLREKFNQFCKKVETMEKDVKSLLKSTTRVEAFLATQSAAFGKLLSGQSPRQLLPKGTELLKKSGFKNVYKDNKNFFLDEINKRKPESPADVDRIANETMLNFIDDKRFAKVKQVAFESGVSVSVIARICSIYLRNEALKELNLPSA